MRRNSNSKNTGKAPKQLPPRKPRSGVLRGRQADAVQPHPRASQLVPVQQYQGSGALVPINDQPQHPQVVQVRLMEDQPKTNIPARRARNTDKISKAGQAVGRAGWRYRWQLAPVAAAGAVVAGAAAEPSIAAAGLAAVAVAGHVGATRLPETIAGRVWLSLRERSTLALGAAGAAAWSAGVAAGLWSVDAGGIGLLALATGYQATCWWRSRRIRGASGGTAAELSEAAQRLINYWPTLIASETGPRPLRGSTIEPGTLTEPNAGTITFGVRLHGVHSQTAAVAEVRRELEFRLGIGINTVELDVDRDDASRLLVTLATSRHLEQANAAWDPVLHPNGDVDLAVTEAGQTIRVGLHNADGVEHAAIVGTTGTGKSNTAVTLVLPGILQRREVLWYIDGGNGTSASHLAYASDWWAVEDSDEWESVIDAAHSVCEARRARRRRNGLSRWRGAEETDPILTLMIDEATLVQPQLKRATVEKVLRILRIGRKVGIRVIQLTQDPLGKDWIGDRQGRGLMAAGGCMIGHRVGDGTASTLAAGSAASGSGIDLRALPPGPGWCGILRLGQILAHKARVSYAAPEAVAEKLAGFDLRGLDGEDLMAAGGDYRSRVRGPVAATEMFGHGASGEPNTAEGTGDDLLTDAEWEEASPDSYAENAVPAGDVENVDNAKPASVDRAEAERKGTEAQKRLLKGSQAAAAAVADLNRNRVRDALSAGEHGLTRTEIHKITGVSKTTVQRALETLADNGKAIRGETDGLWYPADNEEVA